MGGIVFESMYIKWAQKKNAQMYKASYIGPDRATLHNGNFACS